MFEKYKILGVDYVLISLNKNNAILLCTNDIKIKDNTRENLDYSVTILFMSFNDKSVYKDKKFCEFPLKLVRDLERNKNLKYNDIQNISISDPMQGFERMTNDEYVLEHCFGDKDYFEYMEVEYGSIFN